MTELKRVTVISVRVDHEWGTFFVRESEVTPRANSKGFDASAEWTANTSFGVFGHYWSSMGQPFGDFIQGIREDYLLSKIGHKITDERLIEQEVKAIVRKCRKDNEITKETAREAFDTIDALCAEYTGQVLCHELYMSAELSFVSDWCDVSTQSWDGQSLGFARKLWPAFVKQYNEQRGDSMKTEEQVREACHWLSCQPQRVQSEALRQLLEFAIESEWIGIRDDGSPYFRTCGDTLGE